MGKTHDLIPLKPCSHHQREIGGIRSTNLPEGLDEMYGQMLGLVDKRTQSSRALARRVIIWVLYGYQPLNSEELHEALVAGTSWK